MAVAEKPDDQPFRYTNGHHYERADATALKIDRGAGSDDRIEARGRICLARVGTMFCGLPDKHAGECVAPRQRDLAPPEPTALRAQQKAIAEEAKARESKKDPKR